MTYWKELPETFTCSWDLSQKSAANLMLAIALKNRLLENLQTKIRVDFFKKDDTCCLTFELGLPVSSHMTGHT